MMTFPVWIEGILSIIKTIQDVEFQNRVWLRGEGPEFSSWEETMCGFFDDFDVDGLLARSPKESGLSELQYATLKEFREALNEYCGQTPRVLPPAVVLADPRWHKVRLMAEQVLDAFSIPIAVRLPQEPPLLPAYTPPLPPKPNLSTLKPGWQPHGMRFFEGRFMPYDDGPLEVEFKKALTRYFQNESDIKAAYLATIEYPDKRTGRCLCLTTPWGRNMRFLKEIGDMFAFIYPKSEKIDIVFLDKKQQLELPKVCEPFFKRPDAFEILSRPPTPFPFKQPGPDKPKTP